MSFLGFWDYLLLGIFLFTSLGIAFYYSRKANTFQAYFQSEGKLGWFVSGTAMVATTFAADTPLAVTELIYEHGISGNWLWWCMGIGSLCTVYIFAPLWKKSGVITDVELVKLRYSGKGADILRLIKAVYLGVFLNIIVLSWVNLAMQKISSVILPEYSAALVVSCLGLFAFLYTAWVGLTGISYVDAFQFFFAMTGCIILAFFALSIPEVGGMEGVKSKLSESNLYFFPSFETSKGPLSLESFLAMVTVVWWASWYPGSEPGGGGYIAQRLLATKDERSSVLSGLWFVVAHYFLRPWPWIIVGLVSVVLYPNLSAEQSGKGFIYVMQRALPGGLKGLLLASFIAAYLSTIATHLNWGTSYILNDVYKPYIRPNQSDRHYITIAKIVEIFMILASLWVTFNVLESISAVWKFIIEAGAGIGFALIFRWFIPRINAWGELSGFISPLILHTINQVWFGIAYPYSLYFNAFGTIFIVGIVCLITPKTDFETLKEFYQKVSPPGFPFKLWAKKNGIPIQKPYLSLYNSLLLVAAGLIFIYSGLFFVGNIIFQRYELLWIPGFSLLFSFIFQYRYFHKGKISH